MALIDQSFFGIQEEIILTKNGVWLSNGDEITHPGTLVGFSKNIYRNKNGYEIRIGQGEKQEKKQIQVEDTIYFVRALEGNPEDGFLLILNDGRKIPLEPTSLKYKPGRLTCGVPHPNEGTTEEAKFLSAAYYELLNHVISTPKGFEITIQKKTVHFDSI